MPLSQNLNDRNNVATTPKAPFGQIERRSKNGKQHYHTPEVESEDRTKSTIERKYSTYEKSKTLLPNALLGSSLAL